MRKVFIYGDPARNTDGKVKIPVEEKEEKIDVSKVKEIKPFTRADGALLVDYANIPRTLDGVSNDLFLYKILPYLTFSDLLNCSYVCKAYESAVNEFLNKYKGPIPASFSLNWTISSGASLGSLIRESKRRYKELLDTHIITQANENDRPPYEDWSGLEFDNKKRQIRTLLKSKGPNSTAFNTQWQTFRGKARSTSRRILTQEVISFFLFSMGIVSLLQEWGNGATIPLLLFGSIGCCAQHFQCIRDALFLWGCGTILKKDVLNDPTVVAVQQLVHDCHLKNDQQADDEKAQLLEEGGRPSYGAAP